ncbi:BT4734/BF3469 family protein [Xylanibacter ruminicola]|uniref:VirE N-terminal domain-containing protein n=1 Tax=Xylanibacter ruminicola TaxID=839 RepID=A0A1M6SXW2_XYLRU|nr:BT4734/BF3469 family protein [Xylanibacter ruminicola]SHK49509.1 VirE N-terminal domain-containing protein [Xylanibacter ruminicola]
MNITLLKKTGSKEVINRIELAELAAAIKSGVFKNAVTRTREVYHLMNPHRLEDGQIDTQWEGGIKLPRICFAADYLKRKGEWAMISYNGLAMLEVNDLQTYEKAVEIRELAKKLPETMMCFLGGSGRSVKIVCRGQMFGEYKSATKALPTEPDNIKQFHLNLYNTARRAYQNQFGFDIEFLDPRLDRTIYMSADPEMWFNPEARPFYADTENHELPQPVVITREEDHLMPGRTVTRTYHLNWTFIVETVMGHTISNCPMKIKRPLC